jgi:acylphosphatase
MPHRTNGDLKMKLKITITGLKVHDVGYRYHLMGLARSSKLKGFDAENQIADGMQQVEVLVEGDEAATRKFGDIIQISRPPGADISDISFSPYQEEVMKLAEYSSWCTNILLNKGIQVILGIAQTNTKILKGINSIKTDIKDIKVNTTLTPQILEEIKGLREDQPNPAIKQLQLDMATVKARLNIP